MNQLLAKALDEVTKLPPAEQEAIGAILLEELDSERRWVASFAKSQELLAKLGEDALTEHKAGLTKPL